MRSDLYQIVLIGLGVVAAAFFGVFVYREVFPEYKIYQDDFIALEKFRSSYTGETPAVFQTGIKQIVLEKKDKGPPVVDRCTSCHVALEIADYSPTKIKVDINGNTVLDEKGWPVKVPNENYVWKRLEEKIDQLTDKKVNDQLVSQGETSKVNQRLAEADKYKDLETAEVGDYVYDVKKVLAMHPLIGRETRPFEFHPLDQYGCTSCHSGNGKGLTTDKAHGPVYDGQYEYEYLGPVEKFTEPDPDNDPPFSKVFNHKPADNLVFQTTPILVGRLIQAKCVQCHNSSAQSLQNAASTASLITERKKKNSESIKTALSDEESSLAAMLEIKKSIDEIGFDKTLDKLKKQETDYTLPAEQLKHITAQIKYLEEQSSSIKSQPGYDSGKFNALISKQLGLQADAMLGSAKLTKELENKLNSEKINPASIVDKFLVEHKNDPSATGSLFVKEASLNLDQALLLHVEDTENTFNETVTNQKVINSIVSDIDLLTKTYHEGEHLYISQACYACHKIAGFARGGVGPELTEEGNYYPWFIKRKLEWPQGDLDTSTMPNMTLDTVELEKLMTFIFGQRGENKAISDTAYKLAIQQWEAGKKTPLEKPVSPAMMRDLRYSMTVFATEGCSACHRLKGFESNIGYRVEKESKGKADFDTLYKEHEWFTGIIPEMIAGSDLVKAIEEHSKEIDERIVDNVRQNSLLEEIEAKYPETIEALYTPFRYASRAKNHHYTELAEEEKDPKKKEQYHNELKQWKERVHRVLMIFVQEYGLGRLIGPRPNWSGVYRDDEWLMEHFHSPSAHVAKSIMPVFPFDDSKFWALTYMLDKLGVLNRNSVHEIWEHRGFNPELAFEIHCSQCHGVYKLGNGPVAEWIYPIPKNLRNAEFLRNLTKPQVVQSITHGVKGTPMPPWGEVGNDKPNDGIPVLTAEEIELLADWLFSSLPGGNIIKSSEDVPKWLYMPNDAIKELKEEGNILLPGPEFHKGAQEGNPDADEDKSKKSDADLSMVIDAFPTGNGLIASLQPLLAQTLKEEHPIDSETSKYFDVTEPPVTGTEKYGYYIKKKYYTLQNIEQGRQFFEMNCSPCHGTEADGTGLRAAAMREAKPRDLINIDWLKEHDDLYLLRSIKFGVPGTAMTPWGDLTSSLQRMQLVMFIRSLSLENGMMDELSQALFQAFDVNQFAVEGARIKEYGRLEELQKEYNEFQEKQAVYLNKVKEGQPDAKEALELYQQQLTVAEQLKQRKELDDILVQLDNLIKKEAKVYKDIGDELISDNQHYDGDFSLYIQLLHQLEGRFTEDDQGALKLTNGAENEKSIAESGKTLIADLDKKKSKLEQERTVLNGRILSPELDEELTKINTSIQTVDKLKAKIISGLEEGIRLRDKERKLYESYLQKEKSLKK